MTRQSSGFFSSLWDSIAIRLAGKRIAILGARTAGKTRFINFLQTGTVPAPGTEFPTAGANPIPGTRVEIGGISVLVAASEDMGGHESFYNLWKEEAEDAKFIVYLFRADELNKKDDYVMRRIVDDITAIRSWCKAKIVLAGTHVDKDRFYQSFTTAKYKNWKTYNDYLVETETISRAISIAGSTEIRVVSGSLSDENTATELATQVFQVIDKWLG